ncbi:hypothetical protein ASF16_04740 [Acidovorax sp. Leaf78]|nr:hypothetical protein ASF16_04740 [Acidovorax sp. Leaf78]
MQHTGTLFMSKARAEVSKAEDGAFQLTLQLIDSLGTHMKQVYRVRWEGPEAQAFWKAHANDMQPGAIVDARLTRVYQHTGATHPPRPELRATAVSLQYMPKRTPAERAAAETHA